MNDILQKLVILQDRDTALAKTIRELEMIPKEEATITKNLEANSSKFENLKSQSKKIEAERKNLELQVESKKSQIIKYRQQQFETRKNEEFQALGNEILKAEEEIRSLEDHEIDLMEKYEASQKEVAQESIRVKTYTDEASSKKTTLKARGENLLIRKGELQAEIANLEQGIDKSHLDRYRRLLASKKDTAISPVVDGKTCGGCHMSLTHQTIVSVKAGTSIVPCDQCGRILYVPAL